MSDLPEACATFDDSIAELALEILDGDERDTLLAHAATCDRCAAELHQTSVSADRLTLLAPDCEPPVGFEQRVMDSLATRSIERVRPVRRRRIWSLAAAALVLFVVGVGVGVGVGVLAHRHTSGTAAPGPSRFRYAELVGADGVDHGSVSLVSDDDSNADVILTMSLSNLDGGRYHCVIHRADGSSTDVASWPVDETGAGVWALPIRAAIDDVRGVSVVDDDGSTVAITQWPS